MEKVLFLRKIQIYSLKWAYKKLKKAFMNKVMKS